MGLLSNTFGIRAATGNPTTGWATLLDALGVVDTDAGVQVSERKALANSAVLACVKIISETLATLPLHVFQRLDQGKREAREHRLYPILHDQPNPQMSAVVFREALQAQLLLWGNAYAEVQRDGAGRVVALWPLPSDRTYPIRENNKLKYQTFALNYDSFDLIGTYVPQQGELRYVMPENMIHVPGLSFNGLVGYSPIRMAMQAFGLTLAAEKFGALFFGQGANPSMVLTHKGAGTLSEKAKTNIENSVMKATSGSKALRVLVLEDGLEFARLTIPPNEAQFIETRKFQVAEIARIFRVPLHLVQDLERATNNNIEQQGLEFVMHTIRPWAVRWEQELNRKLLGVGGSFYCETSMSALLRGDFKSRAEGYKTLRDIGVFSTNDILSAEGLNTIPEEDGGNLRTVPLNTVPLDQMYAQEPIDPNELAGSTAAGDAGTPGSPNAKIVTVFARLFRDAVGRLCQREKRDAATVAKIFNPALTALAESVIAFEFDVPKLSEKGQCLVSSYCSSIVDRCASWRAEDKYKIAEVELSQAYRAFLADVNVLQELQ